MRVTTFTLNINSDEREVFSLALKKSGIQPFTRNGTIEIKEDTGEGIRDAIVTLFRKKFSYKSKTAEMLHTCMMCERIIEKLDPILLDLGLEDAVTPLINEVAEVVEEIPSLTVEEKEQVVEESPETVETIPSLTKIEVEVVEESGPVIEMIPSFTKIDAEIAKDFGLTIDEVKPDSEAVPVKKSTKTKFKYTTETRE